MSRAKRSKNGAVQPPPRVAPRHDRCAAESFVERFRAGDPDAVALCFEEYLAKFTLRLWRRSRPLLSRDRCEEIVIEAIELAYKKRGQFDPDKGRFEAWLWGITCNCLADELREPWFQEYRQEKPLRSETLFLVVDPDAWDADEEYGAETGGETYDLLATAMETLSEREHAIISADMDSPTGTAPSPELGKSLWIAESTVRWHRAQAIAKLRRELLRLGYQPRCAGGGGGTSA